MAASSPFLFFQFYFTLLTHDTLRRYHRGGPVELAGKALRPKYVIREEQGQVKYDANHGGGDSGQGGGKFEVVVCTLDQGPARQYENEGG